MSSYNIKIPRPHINQQKILESKSRFIVLNSGRRFGKTEVAKIKASKFLLEEKDVVFWVSPNFSMSSRIWQEFKNLYADIIVGKSEQERQFTLLTGGIFRVFSGEKYENIRGESPRFVIFDEAAIFPKLQDAFEAVVSPSLADKKGEAMFLSTPRGHNYFYTLYLLGVNKSDDFESFKFKSWDNPFVPKSEFLKAYKRFTPKLFAQEFEADFQLDVGEVFKGVMQVATEPYFEPYNGRFVFGIDLGKKDDYTVITIFDIDKRQLVSMERLNQTTWTEIKNLIKITYNKWKPQAMVIESNYGDSVIEDLNKDGLGNIIPFWTSNSSKTEIVSGMMVAIQNKTVKLLNDDELIREFQAYKMEYTKMGSLKFEAASGYHDDIVMSACIGFNYFNKSYDNVYVVRLPVLDGWSKNGQYTNR